MKVLRCLAICFALATGATHAAGPLAVCNDASRSLVKYPGAGTISLSYDIGPLGTRSKAQADVLVTNALAMWTNSSTSSITLSRGADLPVDITTANYLTYYNNTSDGIFPVIYDTDGSLIDLLLGANQKSSVVGFAGSSFSLAPTCQYTEGQAIISGFLNTSDTTMTNVTAHEIGHLIGLGHTQLDADQGLAQSNFPLMYPTAFRSTQTLHEDDEAFISTLYPDPSFSSVYGQISGNFVLADGVTAVRGANLWATETTTGKVYSIVSDFRSQATGFFSLSLPAGLYELRAGTVRTPNTGIGPYSAAGGLSFQPPLYVGGVPMANVTLGNATPTTFYISAGCAATATFRIDGTGSIGGNCTPAGSYTMTVSKAGSGTGAVTSAPAGINCGATCQATFATNTMVTLTAVPDPGFVFVGWSGGGCTGTAPCTVTMSTTKTIVATFDPPEFPANCALPSGWTVPGTANAAWSSATDRKRTGTCSLKSNPMLDAAQPGAANANKAQVSISGNYQAGNVSFYYNVSSENGYDCLRFLVDTTEQSQMGNCNGPGGNGGFGASGNISTWTLVTIPVAAGAHTFTWSYEKDEQVTSGSDAAWIDDVVLPPVTLTVARAGAGTGTVSGSGVNCGATCSVNVPGGTAVTLTATPAVGSTFAGWSGGGCTGTGTCTTTLNTATTITATFDALFSIAIAKAGAGAGTVTSNPAGINCGATCNSAFGNGASVTLTAAPLAGSSFAGWTGGGCTGTGTCTVSVTGLINVTATFTLLPVALTVTKSGNGAGTVSGTGIACGVDCTESVAPGTIVALTASPSAGSTFTGWSGGGCAGTGTCNVTVNTATTVTAVFTLQQFILTSAKSGTGSGTVSGTGFNCGVDCTETVNFGTLVVLTATPSVGSSFAGWSGGGCTGTGTCSVTVNAATTVTATFTLLPVTLTVTPSGTGAGTVTGTGIACGIDCTESVAPGTMIALTASPAVGSTFTGWSGGGCAGTGTCNVTVNAATTVTAVFTLQQFTISVIKSGAGAGTVTSSPGTISCGATCSAAFDFGTSVTLTAAAGLNSVFAGWSGGGCAGTAPCTFPVSAAATVTAVFSVAANPPDAPTGVTATAGSGLAVISFTPPANNGGSPVTGYTATCAGTGGTAVSGTASPIVVSPLTNGTLYSCSVKATNINGDSVASASAAVTPTAAAPVSLIGVTSRKNHGAAGDRDLPVQFATPLGGAITVEPRTNSGGHLLRFQFNVPVNSVGAASVVTTGNVVIGSASATADGSNIVTVTLTGVPDNSRALVSVNAINGGAYVAQATIGFLVGDVNGLGSVSASDLSAIKARNTQSASTAFMFDLDRSGTVNAADVSVAKARSGLRLPP